MSRALHITNRSFGKLVLVASQQRSKKPAPKTPSVCAEFAREYFKQLINSTINHPVSHPFRSHGISHVQVLEKPSRKGYEWDRKYDNRDFDLLVVHDYDYATIAIDERFKRRVLLKAEKGMRYQDEIVNPAAQLKRILKELKK